MSIQPLPDSVVAQIKSSSVITSLNNAIFGLVQNSLDANATKINISVDYRRGNCSVEDNGIGIPPAKFRQDGGLGQLHYTSKYPARKECHGRHGEFLASLAALSLLTVASHHQDYRSHNSLTIHNSRVLARHLPAPPDQRVLIFPSGTRVSVRDLFGSMPVRVKQRAAEVERLGTTRYFDQLVFTSVALLLAWPEQVTVVLQEPSAARTTSLHTTAIRSAAQDIVTRTPALLAEASLVDQRKLKSWVSIGATTTGISVSGCVSLQPAATKHVQFISLGIQPLLDEHHSNFLYEEVNKVFINSSFGVVEEARVDDNGKLVKTFGFTMKELKPQKGVDRWPMFFLGINLDKNLQSVDIDELLDENHRQLAKITDLLQVMVYEFLKKHHFRPRSIHAIEAFRAQKKINSASSSRESSVSASAPPKADLRSKTSSKAEPKKKASSRRSKTLHSESRSASPFTSWSRIKSPPHRGLGAKQASSINITAPGATARGETQPVLKPTKPLFDDNGSLLRKPFDDGGNSRSDGTPESDHGRAADAESQDSGPILWIDPVTSSKSLIDPRTGFAVRPKNNNGSVQEIQNVLIPRSSPISLTQDPNPRPPLKRVKSHIAEQQDVVFRLTEPKIPRLPQETEALGCQPKGQTHDCHALTGGDGLGIASKGLEGRISKDALKHVKIINQVDKKFILVKVATGMLDEGRSSSDAGYMLVIIDQHAADERCRVEDLLRGYFVPDLSNPGKLVAESENLDKALRFDLSRREGELLLGYRKHFAYWGVGYNVLLEQDMPLYKGKATVEVRMLPPCILERCQLEPKLLIDLLRKEAWKLHENPRRQMSGRRREADDDKDWFPRFHNCPEGIMEMINSRACRSAIMFNDVLSQRQCADLVQQLAACAFPFQCAHGRPSMWRSFDFFEATQIKITDDDTRAFFESNDVSCVCSGSESLFLASYDGAVRIVSGPNAWKVIKYFQAYESGAPITHMRQVEGTSLLVTIAEEMGEGGTQPILKVWALDKLVKKTGIPTCLSTVVVNNGKKPFPVSAFTATDDLTQVAVGFANGAVTVIRGDLIHDLGTKQRVIFESDEPITGVELHVDSGLTTLFVATTSRILKLVISGKGHGQPPKTVEDDGCGVGCMAVDKRTGEIVVGREDAVYYYTLDGRGPPTAYEAPKKLVAVYHDYIALVSPPSPAGETDTMRRRFWGSAADSIYTFTLIHPDLRIIAHSETVLSDVKHIFSLWGDLYMLTQDGKVFRYHEKTLQQRLDMLYQRNLYTLAVDLAQKCGVDAQQQNVILRKYGDYLYQKGNYDEAMTQYIKAIDSTEPSQVIRKFLDTQRIHNLIEYLEELHEHHKATSDHTTLLLNCYAKLKDIVKLEKFIKSEGDLKFDLDTAISMCRQGGYYEQAAYLAKKHGEHDLVVDILIEDSKSYAEALDFILHLDPETAYPCFMKYARVLIEHCPQDSTQLFIDYYTGKYTPRIDPPVSVDAAPAATNGGFVTGAANAVQNLGSLLPLPYMNLQAVSNSPASAKPTVSDLPISKEVIAVKYTPPRPKTAFSSFIDHPDQFIFFLEECLKDDSLSQEDKSDIYTTLFEMYLHKSNEKKESAHREEWEGKAKQLIDAQKAESPNAPRIENSNVLLLSHLSDFRDGTTMVKEQSGLLFDIFRSYTSAKDTLGAIKALRKYGPQEPQLYPAALSYLTSDSKILEEAGPEELAAVLEHIDKNGLMAPLQVVQALSKNSVANMGMIKGYLTKRIERERKDIAENRKFVTQFRSETEQRRQEIADLGTKPQVFQSSRCGQCSGVLELPVVHFLCRHSFHQRCLRGGSSAGEVGFGVGGGGDGDDGLGECPLCSRDNSTIRALKRSQEEAGERHELFRDDLERSEDRFRTVAEWFGRGVVGGSVVE
ncbi:hypothetical protein QBC38DRAFT_513637 [Podospora fimiseda]|uniref:Vacuolar membrane protein n=1 Tax=Podospora fimiseda TaxID=252190 RepID=A0AAN6YNK4_9PEZI|nr:hypothetical protein QBC38DRAFT_513637 [Podospora fimiseda]